MTSAAILSLFLTQLTYASPEVNCTTVKETVRLRWGETSFPSTGKFVVESHYATEEETFENAAAFPKTMTDEIARHLDLSCALLHSAFGFTGNCADIYRASYERVWTPAEGGGVAGQAARSQLKPSLEQELWQGNLMYASIHDMPAPGTKYIATNTKNGKSVVVSMGFEIGPAQRTFLGGLVTEVQYFLGTLQDDSSKVTLGRAQDQSLPYGPIVCE